MPSILTLRPVPLNMNNKTSEKTQLGSNADGKADEKEDDMVKACIAMADRPLKQLIAKVAGRDTKAHWGNSIMLETGHMVVTVGDSDTEKKYNLSLAVVPADHVLDLGDLTGNSDALRAASCLVSFAQMRCHTIPGFTRTIKVDRAKSTMYLHSSDPYRLSVVVH